MSATTCAATDATSVLVLVDRDQRLLTPIFQDQGISLREGFQAPLINTAIAHDLVEQVAHLEVVLRVLAGCHASIVIQNIQQLHLKGSKLRTGDVR
jgi:hypothetical protein